MIAQNKFSIYFDGGYGFGSKHCYGSWEVQFNGFSKLVSRKSFFQSDCTVKLSNNVAEYMALISALIWLDSVKDKCAYVIDIYGDSQLVINQLKGYYKTRCPQMKIMLAQCKNRLNHFGGFEAHWHKRDNNVARFGH